MIVDGRWSKGAHKHSYNTNSGVAVIFGAETKPCLLVCAINIAAHVQLLSTKNIPIPDHKYYKNWFGSSGGQHYCGATKALRINAWSEVPAHDW